MPIADLFQRHLGLDTVFFSFSTADEIAIFFCGSKKSLASGLPMWTVLFPAATVGLAVLPLMLFHQLQLMVCAWVARQSGAQKETIALASA